MNPLIAAYSAKRTRYVDSPDMETYEDMLDAAIELAESLVGNAPPLPICAPCDDDGEALTGLPEVKH